MLPRWFEQGFEGIYQIVNLEGKQKQRPFIVARLEVNYLEEVDAEGVVTVETGVAQLGNSSFILAQNLIQHGRPAAVSRVTMVYFDYAHKKSVLLPDDVRAALEVHRVEADI
jgi:acyl-CoA thioester hydrolase